MKFKKEYTGLRYKIHRDKYILAQVQPEKFMLIGLDDGNRYTDGVLSAKEMFKYIRQLGGKLI